MRAFTRYHDTPRSPDDIPRLAEARHALDLARSDIGDERRRMRLTHSRPAQPARKFAVDDDDLTRLRIAGMRDSNRAS